MLASLRTKFLLPTFYVFSESFQKKRKKIFFRNLKKMKNTCSRALFVTCLRTWTVQSTVRLHIWCFVFRRLSLQLSLLTFWKFYRRRQKHFKTSKIASFWLKLHHKTRASQRMSVTTIILFLNLLCTF